VTTPLFSLRRIRSEWEDSDGQCVSILGSFECWVYDAVLNIKLYNRLEKGAPTMESIHP
jgi:hypothetical protein